MWIESTENDEAPLIRSYFDEKQDVHPISWYEDEIVDLFVKDPPENWPPSKKGVPEKAKVLLSKMKSERKMFVLPSQRPIIHSFISLSFFKQTT